MVIGRSVTAIAPPSGSASGRGLGSVYERRNRPSGASARPPRPGRPPTRRTQRRCVGLLEKPSVQGITVNSKRLMGVALL